MATTDIQKVTRNRIYSIYFAVIVEDWYKKDDPSEARIVHDEVIVK